MSGASAVISVGLSSKRRAEAVLAALRPEFERPPTRRCRVRASVKGASLSLGFEATDTSALRSAVNSYLRWIATLDRTLALGEETRLQRSARAVPSLQPRPRSRPLS